MTLDTANQHLCSCNSPGCFCVNVVEFSGEICDLCRNDFHDRGQDEEDIDADHKYIVD